MALVELRHVSKIWFHPLSREGRTIALITHDPEIAAFTPRRIEIRDGRVATHVDAKLAGTGVAPRFSAPNPS